MPWFYDVVRFYRYQLPTGWVPTAACDHGWIIQDPSWSYIFILKILMSALNQEPVPGPVFRSSAAGEAVHKLRGPKGLRAPRHQSWGLENASRPLCEVVHAAGKAGEQEHFAHRDGHPSGAPAGFSFLGGEVHEEEGQSCRIEAIEVLRLSRPRPGGSGERHLSDGAQHGRLPGGRCLRPGLRG